MRIISLIIAMSLLLSLCPASAEHVHAFSSVWQGDPSVHYRECACGARSEEGEHVLVDNVCTVCGCEVFIWEDEGVILYSELHCYDENDNPLWSAYYDENGALLLRDTYEYAFDENGVMTASKDYSNGVLIREATYAVTKHGEVAPVHETVYDESGAYTTYEYDEYGDMTRIATIYPKDDDDDYGDTLETFVYTRDEEGKILSCHNVAILGYGEKIESITDHLGSEIFSALYAPDGTPEFIFTSHCNYDEDGHLLSELVYDMNNVLFEEAYFTVTTVDGETYSYCHTRVGYDDERNKLIYEYDDLYNIQRETLYTPMGLLLEEMLYEMDESEEDSWPYCRYHTVYHEDGSKTVSEFNAEEELLSETHYDKDGQVIPAANP